METHAWWFLRFGLSESAVASERPEQARCSEQLARQGGWNDFEPMSDLQIPCLVAKLCHERATALRATRHEFWQVLN